MHPEPPTVRNPFESPIKTGHELAIALGVDVELMNSLIAAAHSSYHTFSRPKKTGGSRQITAPIKPLRALQRRIYKTLSSRSRYPRWMMGGVPKRSVVTHAMPHMGRQMVVTLDVESFFPSVNAEQVASVLGRFAIQGPALEGLLTLTMLNGGLPQGSPASCFLANLVLDRIDRRIDNLCRRHKLSFTRYVDDLAISGNCDLRSFRDAFIAPVEADGFRVGRTEEKLRFIDRSELQVVTGLCVNDKLRPTKRFIRDLKSDIRECDDRRGARLVALERGLSLGRLRANLLGRANHIRQFHDDLGRRLKKRLARVDWT
jgi:RNA-directed DNA polymerase